MIVYALSDLHVSNQKNRQVVQGMGEHFDDILILAGDICEKLEDLQWTFEVLQKKFKKLCWVPGNHELWTVSEKDPAKGQERYEQFIKLCKDCGVISPEDPYQIIESEGMPYYLVPTHLLYDYSFHPAHIPDEKALEWAAEADLVCADEYYLHPNPFATRQEWCHHRVQLTEQRLDLLDKTIPIILVNHFQLRNDVVIVPKIPRFSIWCGTRKTENWHQKYNIKVVISGHLHFRCTLWRHGVRFEEVSLGNPGQYNANEPVDYYLRQILPGDDRPGFTGSEMLGIW